MPLPKPKPGEGRNTYVSRCMESVKKENPDRLQGQVVAMCEQNYSRSVHLQTPAKVKALGNAMVIEGTLLKPGIWVGLDGVPTKYTETFINKVKDTIIGKPIYFAHDISPESPDRTIPKGTTVGFFTDAKDGNALKVRGYVFHPRAIEYLRKHPRIGLSMEAQVTGWNAGNFEVAEDGTLTGGALIEDPACPACWVSSAREINLERGKKMEKDIETQNTTERFIEFKADAKPTKEAFFEWIEKQMKDAGVPDAIIPKAIAVLKKAIRAPYPYPYPKAQEVLEAEFGKDVAEEANKFLMSYREYMTSCMKAGHDMKECAEWWKSASKYPKPTYPLPTAKKAEEDEEIAKLRAELEATKRALDQRAEEEIAGIVNNIKELDKDFVPDRFLEGITCKDLQKKVLQKYLETLKKHARPIRLQIGEDAAKTVVQKEIEEMFGKGVTLESILELKESGK